MFSSSDKSKLQKGIHNYLTLHAGGVVTIKLKTVFCHGIVAINFWFS